MNFCQYAKDCSSSHVCNGEQIGYPIAKCYNPKEIKMNVVTPAVFPEVKAYVNESFAWRMSIEDFIKFMTGNQLKFSVVGYEDVASPIIHITGQENKSK